MTKNQEIELFVPGRLCLFGEHTDWAGRYTDINSELMPGLAIVTGIDLGIYGRAEESDNFNISAEDENGKTVSFTCEMKLETLKEKAKEPKFFSYACGVAAYMLEHYQVGGLKITIDKTTLPIKKGLSSSASICVLVARAFNEIYHLRMSINGEMQAAYRGELLTSSRCGRLDQACAYGVVPVRMEFFADEISVEQLKVGKNLHWVFCDLNAKKDTIKILADLHKAFPFAQNDQDKNVQEALGFENHQIINEAVKLLASGDAEKLGELMVKAQEIFDKKIAPACLSELTAPKLHSILNDQIIKSLTFGGKGVGSQGDGSVQFIAKDKENQKKLVDYLNDNLQLQGYSFTILASDRIKKAIIPLAGFGTRMYPATRFIKKSFLPIVDKNGIAKPVIMCLLEELDEAGIEEIILIVGKDELEQYKEFFSLKLSDEHLNKLSERITEYERLISKINKKIKFAVQEERRGFGHAVYQAKKYLENEPVLLLLGDFIYKSNLNMSCTTQTINAYYKSSGQLPVISIKETPLQDVVHYGIIKGEFDNKYNYLMKVEEMAEKPTTDYAEENLAVNVKNNNTFFSTFGQYVLTPDVFSKLEEDITEHEKTNDSSEIQLTNALIKVLKESGMIGVWVNGESFDVGIPKAYLETVKNYGIK